MSSAISMSIRELAEFVKLHDPKTAIMLRGNAGVGKTTFVSALAEERGLHLEVLRLSEREAGDLVGMPIIKDNMTTFAAPEFWFALQEKPSILCFDEFDRPSTPATLNVCMQILNERTLAGKKLPDHTQIWVLVNGEQYMTTPIDQAIMSRMAVIDVVPTVEDWLNWAEAQGNIDETVINFIRMQPNQLDTPDQCVGQPNIKCQDRRAWVKLGEFLARNKKEIPLDKMFKYSAPYVGTDAGLAFAVFFDEQRKNILTAEDVLTNKKRGTVDQLLEVLPLVAAEVNKLAKADEFIHAIRAYANSGSREAYAAFIMAVDEDHAIMIGSVKEFKQINLDITEEVNKDENIDQLVKNVMRALELAEAAERKRGHLPPCEKAGPKNGKENEVSS
jgi:hypothetical protein